MPTDSNAVYLTVVDGTIVPSPGPGEPPTIVGPLEEVGWEVRCLKASDWTTILLDNPEYISITFSIVLNGVGGGSISFDQDQPLFQSALADGSPASDLLTKENLWQFFEDGVLRVEWISETVEEKPIENDETRSIVISGPTTAHVLTWAVVLPPTYPNNPSSSPSNTSFYWTFDQHRPLMEAWLTLLHTSQQRGTITFVHPTFTATNDSAGQGWVISPEPLLTNIFGYKPDLGSNLLEILNIITGQDPNEPSTIRVDWVMRPGFNLDVRARIGSHRENSVVFYESTAIMTKERTRTRDQVQNLVVVREELTGKMSVAADAVSKTNFKQREVLIRLADQAFDDGVRALLAGTFLQINNSEVSSWTIKVLPSAPGRRVFFDYDIGDWVGISTQVEPTTTPYRVLGISGTVDSNGQFEIELILESIFDYQQILLERRIVYLEHLIPKGLPAIPGVDMSTPPVQGDLLGYNANTGTWMPTSSFGDGSGSGGFGTGGGIKMFIQSTDPGSAAGIGDLWLQT